MLSFERIKERKLVQWALAYLAGAWVLLQVAGELRDTFSWPPIIVQVLTILLAIGFFAALVLAWYHGEKGQQRVSGPELVMMAALLVIAGMAVAFVGGNSAPVTPHASRTSAAEAAAPPPTAPAEHASVAVLPFADISPAGDQEYFSDGLTEELLNALAQVPGLRVAARTSSFAFKDRNVPVDEIGKRLRVANVLEGSVRKSGNRLRITAQLVSTSNGYRLWTEKYDRELEDVFAIQEEISRAIVRALELRLTSAVDAPLVTQRTESLEAHDLYLKGQFFLRKFTEPDLRTSLAFYQKALAADPAYALAWTGVAAAWIFLADDWVPPREAYPRAREAASKALALDPTLAEAHLQLGRVLFYYEWDFAGAERAQRRAIELNPNLAAAYGSYGDILEVTGRAEAAIAMRNREVALDPVTPLGVASLGDAVAATRRYHEAAEQLQRAVDANPDFEFLYLSLGDALLLADRPQEAMNAFRRATGFEVKHRVGMARAAAALGHRDEARRILRELEAEAARRYVRGEQVAAIYVALGDRDGAFRWLEEAYRARSAGLIWLKAEPRWDPIRSDPRFTQLLRRVGLS